jgi:hypothetical protein
LFYRVNALKAISKAALDDPLHALARVQILAV